MSNDFYTLVTAGGRALEVESKASNTSLSLTRMAVGDGGGKAYNPVGTETGLKNEVWRGDLNALYQHPDNPAWLVAECVLPDQVGGWWVREVGLITSTGVLYAIAKYPETFKPVFEAGANKMLYIRMIFEVSNTANVTLLVDPSIVLATRQYCDSKVISEIHKLDGKQSVRVATTAPILLNGLQTVDGVVLAAGDRVLVKNQGTAAENGIYIAAVEVWTRSADADANIEVTPGLFVPVEEGVVNADSIWQLVTDAPITVGTTGLAFEMATGKTGVIAGTYDGITVNARGQVIGGTNTTTPVQFDNSTKKATTEFVQRALGNYQSGVQVSASKSLTGADAGKVFQITANGVAMTLPSPANAYKNGLAFTIFSDSYDWTLTSGTANIFNGRSSVSSMPVKVGTSVTVVSTDGASWFVLGSGALPNLGIFAASMSGNGYQKLPSGLIIQWGVISVAPSSVSTVTYPIAFPNAMLAVFATNGFSSYTPSNTPFVGITPSNTPKAAAIIQNGYSASGNNIYWLAIGN